jgi:hypothetical protein
MQEDMPASVPRPTTGSAAAAVSGGAAQEDSGFTSGQEDDLYPVGAIVTASANSTDVSIMGAMSVESSNLSFIRVSSLANTNLLTSMISCEHRVPGKLHNIQYPIGRFYTL